MLNQRHRWTDDEINFIYDLYNSGLSVQDIASQLNTSSGAIYGIFKRNKFPLQVRSRTDCRLSADYHSYDWCYKRYIEERKSYEEMALEANCKPRTIQKWCSEKHRLNRRTLRKELHLTDVQKELIMFSLLGDGHICKREREPLFIVSHAANQKDYLFWKYKLLKNVCNHAPTLYTNKKSNFNTDKTYLCQDFYKFNTKICDDLLPIRNMSRSDIISQLNEFGLSIHLLDDGSCSQGYWNLCYAAFTPEEKVLYCTILKEKFNLEAHVRKDERYIGFNKKDSQKISEIILRNIPNDLDIIKYKILKDDNYA